MPVPSFGPIALDLDSDLQLISFLTTMTLPGADWGVPEPCNPHWTCLACLTWGLWDW